MPTRNLASVVAAFNRFEPTGAVPPLVVDPHAGRVARSLLRLGPWLRPVRWLIAGLAAYMALQIVPYALWDSPAPQWAVAGFVVAAACWVLLPRAVMAAWRRSVVQLSDLGPGTRAGALLEAACAARARFVAAAELLDADNGATADGRQRVAVATWSVASRARALTGSDGHEAGALEGAALDLVQELEAVADVTERAAESLGGADGTRSRAGLSEEERAALEGMRSFRRHLAAVEEAWRELDPGRG
ncbi:MAG TPA: hypothetical protein VGR90_00295 [Acidimicrobiales bacterium]|nr:hypothetical protein [Acidimicrobiales bacterium]